MSGDHLNKPDVAASIARQWFDQNGVDVITDVGNSAAAIAVTTIAQEKDKIQLNSAAGSSELTGKYCSPNLIHWTYDTWALAHTMVKALVGRGGDKWYFVTADYTFGHSIQNDTTSSAGRGGGQGRRVQRLSVSRYHRFLLLSSDGAGERSERDWRSPMPAMT